MDAIQENADVMNPSNTSAAAAAAALAKTSNLTRLNPIHKRCDKR
jgi:hypothetical protein